MLIDWVTVCAQVINFFILVWLLNRFLFKPILKIVEERNQRIKNELENAATEKKESLKERKDLLQEKEVFSTEKNSLLAQAAVAAQKEKEQLMQSAKKEYEALRHTLQDEIQKEKKTLFSDMKKEIEEEVFCIVKKALQDLAHKDLEEQIIQVFIQNLKKIDPQEKEKILLDIKNFSIPILLRTTFEVPSEKRLPLEKNLHEIFGNEVSFSFEENSDLLCGIELVTSSHKIDWNLSQYFSSMRKLL